MTISVSKIKALKGKRKIVALTAYDFLMARMLDESGVDVVLVGDSLGMVVYGEKDTKGVSVDDIIRHTGAVMNGVKSALVVADLPYGCSFDQALRVRDELSCNCVKVEGQPELVAALVREGFDVMGHTGLKPQQVEEFKVQTDFEEEAMAIEDAGAFSVVLECVPADMAQKVTDKLKIPTIGIGAGSGCDGQILVLPDMLGMNPEFKPKFLREYADLDFVVRQAVKRYKEDVIGGDFPSMDESY